MTKNTGTRKSVVTVTPVNMDGLLDQLRALILQARQQALRTVDVVQVRTCWERLQVWGNLGTPYWFPKITGCPQI